jgi:hypothetical protein
MPDMCPLMKSQLYICNRERAGVASRPFGAQEKCPTAILRSDRICQNCRGAECCETNGKTGFCFRPHNTPAGAAHRGCLTKSPPAESVRKPAPTRLSEYHTPPHIQEGTGVLEPRSSIAVSAVLNISMMQHPYDKLADLRRSTGHLYILQHNITTMPLSYSIMLGLPTVHKLYAYK